MICNVINEGTAPRYALEGSQTHVEFIASGAIHDMAQTGRSNVRYVDPQRRYTVVLGPSWNAPIGALPHDDRAGTHDGAPILKFEHRFARQNIYELPSEFPLTSPYSSIVHILSGRKVCAFARTFQSVMSWSADDASHHRTLTSRFHFAYEFESLEYSHTFYTPWSVLQDGSIVNISPTSVDNFIKR